MTAPSLPAFAPEGWVQWPDHQELSRELARLLGSCQQGGATISECIQAASRVDPDDPETWSAEWGRLAETNAGRAVAAQKAGRTATSRSNWLRAVNYFNAAAFSLDHGSAPRAALLARMGECARAFIGLLVPTGQLIEIAWCEGYSLEGYFLPARRPGPAPVLVCLAEPGERKEHFLHKIAQDALARGLSVLVVDVLGTDRGARFDTMIGLAEFETAVSACIDFLQSRDDVDGRRIAILGDGCSSSYVARGVARDGRVAAAICDGGLWDLIETAVLFGRGMADLPERAVEISADALISRLGCPVLVPLGERSWLKPDFVRPIVEHVGSAGRDVSLRVFSAEETAASQGHTDNPTLANEAILDWLDSRLSRAGSLARDSR